MAVTEAMIVELVEGFYARVRRDPVLAPVFERAIADSQWAAHLERMAGFWSSVMLTSGRYKGNPLAVHAALPDLSPPLFERWLALFGETAGALFAPEVAAAFRSRAARIAESLQLGLFFRPGPPGLRVRPARCG